MSLGKYIIFGWLALQVTSLSATEYEKLLDDHLLKHGHVKIEGNCCGRNTRQPTFFKNFVRRHPELKIIGEIGFNAGHSSVLFLESSKKVLVYAFDIMRHNYVLCGKEFVDTHFPGRHTLIPGNSKESVPQFHKENPSIKFDMIFIDGGHRYEDAYSDIVNMKELSHKDTYVIIDDLCIASVKKAYDECVAKKILIPGTVEISKNKIWTVCKYRFP